MFDTYAIQTALSAFYYAGVVCTGLAIINDPWRVIYRILRGKRDSEDFTRRKYLGFFPYMITMFHYGLLIWFTIPATNRPDTPLMVLSAFAITAQCAITITLICKLKAKRQKLFIIMFWMVFASLDAVIVVVTFLYYETHHERQLFLGDALIVSSFLTLVTTVVDMRVLRRPEEVKELSVVNSILGFAGALFMMIYGILYREKLIWTRQAINATMHLIILLMISKYYKGRYTSAVQTTKSRLNWIRCRLLDALGCPYGTSPTAVELQAIVVDSPPAPTVVSSLSSGVAEVAHTPSDPLPTPVVETAPGPQEPMTVSPRPSVDTPVVVSPPPEPRLEEQAAESVRPPAATTTDTTAEVVSLVRVLTEIQQLRNSIQGLSVSIHNIEAKVDLLLSDRLTAIPSRSIQEIQEVQE